MTAHHLLQSSLRLKNVMLGVNLSMITHVAPRHGNNQLPRQRVPGGAAALIRDPLTDTHGTASLRPGSGGGQAVIPVPKGLLLRGHCPSGNGRSPGMTDSSHEIAPVTASPAAISSSPPQSQWQGAGFSPREMGPVYGQQPSYRKKGERHSLGNEKLRVQLVST